MSIVNFSMRDQGLNYTASGEERALRKLCGKFSKEMLDKVIDNIAVGFEGWGEPSHSTKAILVDKLIRNLQAGDMVDVANLAMFIWNLNDGKQIPIIFEPVAREAYPHEEKEDA